jgi:hypothetical protein
MRKMWKPRLLLSVIPIAAVSLVACGPYPRSQKNTITIGNVLVKTATIDAVLARVKQEIGLFLADSVTVNQSWPALLDELGGGKGNPIKPVCGTGQIDFDIKSVKMDFQAISDVKGGANAGFKIPVLSPASAASIGPSANLSYDDSSTEDINYTYYPPTTEDFQNTWSAADAKGKGLDPNQFNSIRPTAVILPALNALRDGLTRATTHYPCFLNAPASDADSTLVFTVVLVEDANVSGGFDFYIVSLGASIEKMATGTNTITVTFHPTNPGVKTAIAKPKA